MRRCLRDSLRTWKYSFDASLDMLRVRYSASSILRTDASSSGPNSTNSSPQSKQRRNLPSSLFGPTSPINDLYFGLDPRAAAIRMATVPWLRLCREIQHLYPLVSRAHRGTIQSEAPNIVRYNVHSTRRAQALRRM